MKERRQRGIGLVGLVGPGLLLAATGVGAGDLATAALAGNHVGLAIGWAVLVGAFLKFVINEGLTRWQLVTGETLLEGALHRLGWVVPVVFLPYLLMWSFFVGAALMSACGIAMHAMVPVFEEARQGKVVFGILHSLAGVGLVLLGGFRLFSKVMMACIGIMFVVVLTTAVVVCEDWGGVWQGLLVPRIPEAQGAGLGWTVALMGGVGGTLTVLCYGYWLRETGRSGPGELTACRLDLGLAYGATALFGVAMVIIGSAIPQFPPGGGAGLVVELANLLEASLGPLGKWAFLAGAWCAIFSSLFGVWQAVPYLFADFWYMSRNRRKGGDCLPVEAATITRSAAYRGYLFALAIVPMLGLLGDFSRVQKVYAVFGALFMPLLALVLLVLNGRKAWMGARRNRPVTVVILVGTLLLFLYFGFR